MLNFQPGTTLIIASHNTGKIDEIKKLLSNFQMDISSAIDWGLTEPEETEDSFVGNALLKAHSASQKTKQMALADDSGLVVPALNGAPGIFSARWAGPERNFNIAMQRVHHELGPHADRSAYFVCVLALTDGNQNQKTFEGRIDGQIVWPPRGSLGFGYDPIFIPNGYRQTFGEMHPDQKATINHRAMAFKKMLSFFKHITHA